MSPTRRGVAILGVALTTGACSSSGNNPGHVAVPDVVGMDVKAAVRAMDANGYCIGTVWTVEGGAPGVVVGQQPGPQNETVGPGYLIGLEIVPAPGLRQSLSATTISNCIPEIAPPGTVNGASFYRGSTGS